MLYAARGQHSLLLLLLFTGWVLAPFCVLMWTYVASRNWALSGRALHGVIYFVTLGSLTIYGTLAVGILRAKNGFIFLVVPAGAWVIIAIALALFTQRAR